MPTESTHSEDMSKKPGKIDTFLDCAKRHGLKVGFGNDGFGEYAYIDWEVTGQSSPVTFALSRPPGVRAVALVKTEEHKKP